PCARRTHFTVPPTSDGPVRCTGRRWHVSRVYNVSDRPVKRLVLVPKFFFLVPDDGWERESNGMRVLMSMCLERSMVALARRNHREGRVGAQIRRLQVETAVV